MATASELRQILKEDAAGKNLYDHLTETLMRIVMDRPSNAYDAFELISADIKANPLNPDPEAGKAVPPSEEQVSVLNRTSIVTTGNSILAAYNALQYHNFHIRIILTHFFHSLFYTMKTSYITSNDLHHRHRNKSPGLKHLLLY